MWRRASGRAWEKLVQRGAEDVSAERMPEPANTLPIGLVDLVPRFVL